MSPFKYTPPLSIPVCHKIFPLGVYENQVSCHAETKTAILHNYESEKFPVKCSSPLKLPDGRIVQADISKFTGEAHGLATFHKKPQYKVFFSELACHANAYLRMLGIDEQKTEIYVMKSWLVIHDDHADSMPFHVHPESNISFVYYAQTLPCSQSIVFRNDSHQNDISPDIFYSDVNSANSLITEETCLNKTEFQLNVREGMLVMFPGWRTNHGTRMTKPEAFDKDTFVPRLAIAGDLKVVLKPDRLATMTLSSSLEHWEKL